MILLDTHVLVWWLSDPTTIPAPARGLIDDAAKSSEGIAVSSITVWEIAMLAARERLVFTIPVEAWMARVEALPFLSFVPVDNRIAVRAVQLLDFTHKDPADRLIVATALGAGATLVTADQRLRAYSPLKTVWD